MVAVNYASEQTLVAAIEGNLHEFIRLWGTSPAVEVHEEPHALWFISGVPYPIFNGVLYLRSGRPDVRSRIKEMKQLFRSRNVPGFWWVGPATTAPDMDKHLRTAGLTHLQQTPGMAFNLRTLKLESIRQSGLTIERVADLEALEDWLTPFSDAFNMPDFAAEAMYRINADIGFDDELPLHNFVARIDGEPVACGTLFLGAGVAGVWNVATIASGRRQGIGEAVTVELLRTAMHKGYEIGVLHSTEMALKLYQRLGFKQYCSIGQYVWL